MTAVWQEVAAPSLPRIPHSVLRMRQGVIVERQRVSSGTKWEGLVGYSRAVRVGNQVFVAGTTATDERGNVVGAGDPEAQAAYAIEKIGRALQAAGGSLADVVRTRVYVTRVGDWEAVGRAHAHYFGDVRPANTLVEVSALVGADYLVEIEADAVLATSDEPRATSGG